MKQNAKTVLVELEFQRQNAKKKPIENVPAYWVQCTLLSHPITRPSFLIFRGSGFKTMPWLHSSVGQFVNTGLLDKASVVTIGLIPMLMKIQRSPLCIESDLYSTFRVTPASYCSATYYMHCMLVANNSQRHSTKAWQELYISEALLLTSQTNTEYC